MSIWMRSAALVLAAALFACATQSTESVSRADMRRRLADMKLAQGEVEMAIREYRGSIEIYDRDPEAYFGLAEAYRRKGLLPESEKALLEALRIDPKHQEARLNLGVLHLLQERWQDAIKQNRILIDDPTFLRPSRALVNLGWAYFKLGNIEEAKRSFEQALAEDRASFHAHLNLGIVLFEGGEMLESIRHYRAAIASLERRPFEAAGSAEAEARFRMAQAHVKLGQLDQAVTQLRAAAESDGRGEWGQRSREYLQILQ